MLQQEGILPCPWQTSSRGAEGGNDPQSTPLIFFMEVVKGGVPQGHHEGHALILSLFLLREHENYVKNVSFRDSNTSTVVKLERKY